MKVYELNKVLTEMINNGQEDYDIMIKVGHDCEKQTYGRDLITGVSEIKTFENHPQYGWIELDSCNYIGWGDYSKFHAHWIPPRNDDGMSDPIEYQVRCSHCGFDIDPQAFYEELKRFGGDKYCPCCGYIMDEVNDNE
jgi:hypothetical protein